MSVVERHRWGSAPEFIGPRHELRERLLLDLFLTAAPGQRVLNAGAGQGTFSLLLERHGFDVVSTDLSGECVAALRQTLAGQAVEADVNELPFGDREFDAAVLGEVLEHIEDDGAAVREVGRVLKPGGIVAISVPANPEEYGPADVAAGRGVVTEVAVAERRAGVAARARVLTPARVVYSAAVAWGVAFAALATLRHVAFQSTRYDLGNMVQAVWSTAHGHFLQTTSSGGIQFMRIGGHFDPILALFAPLWWVWPSPVMLVVVQALALASGALPVFWLGRKHLASVQIAAWLAIAYLLYAPIQLLTVDDFHPVALGVPLLLFALWYLDEDRLAAFAACAVLAALTGEEFPALVAWLGIWYAVRRRRVRAGSVIAVAGLAAS